MTTKKTSASQRTKAQPAVRPHENDPLGENASASQGAIERQRDDDDDTDGLPGTGTMAGDDPAVTGKASPAASSLIVQLVGSVVGDNLQDAIASVKAKVAEQMDVHGAEYLESARTHLIEATEKVVEWGKKHPVQAVAAATALIGVSAFLYATLRKKDGPEASKRSGKASQ